MKFADPPVQYSDARLFNYRNNRKLTRDAPGSVGFLPTSQGRKTIYVVGDYDSHGDGIQGAYHTCFVKIVWIGDWGFFIASLRRRQDGIH